MSETTVAWSDGTWRHPPVRTETTPAGTLVVEAAEGSDAWQKTSYGFVHTSEHGLLRPFELGTAVEVEFVVDLSAQFDQLGLLLHIDDETWIKAGVEFADGHPRLGAVATRGYSDWSTAAVSSWAGRTVRLRASWADDAVTIRAALAGEPLQLVRLAPFFAPPSGQALAGPYLCAPTRAGFTAEFTAWRVTDADGALH